MYTEKNIYFYIYLLVLEAEKLFVASVVSHLVILVQMAYCLCTCIQSVGGRKRFLLPHSDTLSHPPFLCFLMV